MIITPPEDQAIALGENVTFTCIASGTNPPSIVWTQIVDGNATVRIDIQMLEVGNTVNSTLTISDVLEEDFGSYQCIASDRLIIDIANFTVYQAGKQYQCQLCDSYTMAVRDFVDICTLGPVAFGFECIHVYQQFKIMMILVIWDLYHSAQSPDR